ncbi:MAG: hypothetical protein Phog2KO_21070 [Phototrophicaceae bacterium]
MAEEIVEQEIVETPEIVDEEDVDYGPPRGTVAFVALMIIGYIIYYGIHYVEIFILRGA